MEDYQNQLTSPCNSNCWYYTSFGGERGCGQQESINGNPWPEPIQPGDPCIHPNDINVKVPVYVGSSLGLCEALGGNIIQGGPHDNTSIVRLLIES